MVDIRTAVSLSLSLFGGGGEGDSGQCMRDDSQPLSFRQGCAERLLEHPSIDVRVRNSSGQDAASIATRCGRESFAAGLIARRHLRQRLQTAAVGSPTGTRTRRRRRRRARSSTSATTGLPVEGHSQGANSAEAQPLSTNSSSARSTLASPSMFPEALLIAGGEVSDEAARDAGEEDEDSPARTSKKRDDRANVRDKVVDAARCALLVGGGHSRRVREALAADGTDYGDEKRPCCAGAGVGDELPSRAEHSRHELEHHTTASTARDVSIQTDQGLLPAQDSGTLELRRRTAGNTHNEDGGIVSTSTGPSLLERVDGPRLQRASSAPSSMGCWKQGAALTEEAGQHPHRVSTSSKTKQNTDHIADYTNPPPEEASANLTGTPTASRGENEQHQQSEAAADVSSTSLEAIASDRLRVAGDANTPAAAAGLPGARKVELLPAADPTSSDTDRGVAGIQQGEGERSVVRPMLGEGKPPLSATTAGETSLRDAPSATSATKIEEVTREVQQMLRDDALQEDGGCGY